MVPFAMRKVRCFLVAASGFGFFESDPQAGRAAAHAAGGQA